MVWLALAAMLSLAVAALAWIASRAVGEWERSTLLLVDQRSEEALTLLTVALNRDMKGVHHSVLASFSEGALNLDRRYELEDLFAQAFARFPYPESFFVWRDDLHRPPSSFVFNRVDRQPQWAGEQPFAAAYPVVAIADASVLAPVVDRIRETGLSGRRFDVFTTAIAGVKYQVVVRLLYHTIGARPLLGAVGFMVNLEWVADHYFDEILTQISRIGNVEESIALAVADDTGRIVASTHPPGGAGVLHERTFPLSFLDAELLAGSELDQSRPQWRLSVSAADDRTLLAATRGSARTRWLILLCAGAAIMGIVFTMRALKASADLASLQSEFVASATHDLKTPLALFQLVAETLNKGRYPSTNAIRGYGAMLAEQTQLLERLIDNVLAYASLRHVAQRYHFEAQSVSALIEAALERFDARLAASGLEVNVDVPGDLPTVRGDRVSLLQVLDNVIDNALRYAPEANVLSIRARADNRFVEIAVTDQGIGIPLEEREKVFEKFYRGRGAPTGGSGLGLAIAQRVVQDHGGTITLDSAQPQGTTVTIRLRLSPA
jgi:signal transduction histidine kinase